MTGPAIATRGLVKRYGRRTGLDALDLEVPEGVLFGFLGPNGAGKTTTIRVLLGFLRPTAGDAAIFGRDSWRESLRIRHDVGYLPGDLRLYPWMTCRTAVATMARVRGRELRAAGLAFAERLSLDPDVKVHRMSRGMRQKLGLILALVHEPRLVVLDEPLAGLDPLVQDELAKCLRECAAGGRTVFFSSHTLSAVEHLCDHVAVVRAGRSVAQETIASLRERAPRSVTLRFADAEVAGRIDVPDFLGAVNRRGAEWRGELAGAAPEFVRWAAAQPIEDLTIGAPELDAIFRSFYQGER